MTPDHIAEIALIEISRTQREAWNAMIERFWTVESWTINGKHVGWCVVTGEKPNKQCIRSFSFDKQNYEWQRLAAIDYCRDMNEAEQGVGNT